jgi:F0F1-type ATP synthase membrane subunit b/b'
MEWNFVSFFLNSESFIEFNTNILETNLINIFLLFGLILYLTKTSFSVTLGERQQGIIQTIENAQQDVVNASKYYDFVQKGRLQSLFCLQSWRILHQKEKVAIVNIKYNTVKKGLLETFSTTENLISNFENKAFISLQRYIILITASKMLRKYLNLSEKEQSKVLELTISKLGDKK